MKLLHIDYLRFELPDNFNGSISDAFRELAKFLETPSKKLSGSIFPDSCRWHPTQNDSSMIWQSFLETQARGGKLDAKLALKKLKKDGKAWVKMPLKL